MAQFKRKLIGTVVSNKMQKTAVVEVVRRVKHPLFEKYFTKRKKYKVHDEKNECGIGDRVVIKECPPISREKRFVMVEVLVRENVA